MTYEDYMLLPKETLAKELARRDYLSTISAPMVVPPFPSEKYVPCYHPDGVCTNPFRDCVNCPKVWSTGGFTTTTTADNTNVLNG